MVPPSSAYFTALSMAMSSACTSRSGVARAPCRLPRHHGVRGAGRSPRQARGPPSSATSSTSCSAIGCISKRIAPTSARERKSRSSISRPICWVRLHDVLERLAVLGDRLRAAKRHLRLAAQDGERGAELVADVGEEQHPHLVEPLQPAVRVLELAACGARPRPRAPPESREAGRAAPASRAAVRLNCSARSENSSLRSYSIRWRRSPSPIARAAGNQRLDRARQRAREQRARGDGGGERGEADPEHQRRQLPLELVRPALDDVAAPAPRRGWRRR